MRLHVGADPPPPSPSRSWMPLVLTSLVYLAAGIVYGRWGDTIAVVAVTLALGYLTIQYAEEAGYRRGFRHASLKSAWVLRRAGLDPRQITRDAGYDRTTKTWLDVFQDDEPIVPVVIRRDNTSPSPSGAQEES